MREAEVGVCVIFVWPTGADLALVSRIETHMARIPFRAGLVELGPEHQEGA